jgi:NitT/TauT family transport system substrate-binding protein
LRVIARCWQLTFRLLVKAGKARLQHLSRKDAAMRLPGVALATFLLVVVSAQAETINIGIMPLTNQNEIVADRIGLYKQNGLDVKLKLFQTGPAAIQGLLSGDLQAVEAGAVTMLNLASQNIGVYFLVSCGMNTPQHLGGSIMIRPNDNSIKSFADVKGKKLGTLPKGTITTLWISNAVARYGMKREEIQEIFVPFPTMGELLASNQVDAIYVWPPFDTMIEQAGHGRILVNDVEWNPYAMLCGLIVRKDWADKNPDDLRKLVKSSIQADRWIDDHVDEARALFGQGLKLSPSVYEKMRMFYYPRNGYQAMPSVWDFYYLMIKAGVLQPLPDINAALQKYWFEPADRFIAPVLTEIGRQEEPITKELLKIKLENLPGPISDYLAPWEH